MVTNPPASAGDMSHGFHPRARKEIMVTHSSILVWRIPWTEEPGGLQSVGSQRVRHDRSDLTHREREKALEGRGVTTEMGTERVSGKGRVACQLEDTA